MRHWGPISNMVRSLLGGMWRSLSSGAFCQNGRRLPPSLSHHWGRRRVSAWRAGLDRTGCDSWISVPGGGLNSDFFGIGISRGIVFVLSGHNECTSLWWVTKDISQVGNQAGLHGDRSSLIKEAFKTFDRLPKACLSQDVDFGYQGEVKSLHWKLAVWFQHAHLVFPIPHCHC